MSVNDTEREIQRRSECFYRTEKKSCARIDILLGWEHLIPIQTCDQCWQSGAGSLEGSEAFCWDIVEKEAEIWKKPENLKRAPQQVLVALTVHHLEPDARKELVGNPDFKKLLSGKFLWEKVRSTWDPASIASFFKSMKSRIGGGKIDATSKALRIRSCTGIDEKGERVRLECPFYKVSLDKVHHYCGACGCGDKPWAHLDKDEGGYDKWDYPYLECPLEEEGYSNAAKSA